MAMARTPLSGYPVVAGEYQITLAIEDMNPLKFPVDVKPGDILEINRTLIKNSNDLAGMVMINKGTSQNGAEIPALLIDQHEITNGEFFNFVSSGGFREKKYWVESRIVKGLSVSLGDGLRLF